MTTVASSDVRPKIVLVDDDAAVRAALTFAFQIDGFEVEAFESGEDVLAAKTLPSAGCLVVDQRMSGMAGLDMVAQLRARGSTLPAVLITTPTTLVRRAAAAANVPIVEKPLMSSALIDQVRQMVVAPPPAP
jgi:two-component system C4-dicarboxylate transport response regulator DctD